MEASASENRSCVFMVMGEPASKSNSRRIVRRGGRVMSIKSEKALRYVEQFEKQCPVLPDLLEGDVSVTLHIYYASRRPDMDESIILDCMQGRIYTNDRQVKERHAYWHLDRKHPRAEIAVTECGSVEARDLASDTGWDW